MNTDLMFSTGKDDWATPPEVFDPLNAEFGFDLDAAALAGNAKCARYLGPDQPVAWARDALKVKWHALEGVRSIWINPPYSRGLQGAFIEKAAQSVVTAGYIRSSLESVVMLLPARTDTRAFHDHIWNNVLHGVYPYVRSLRLLKGRVRFVGAPASAPFPSMIVVFGS